MNFTTMEALQLDKSITCCFTGGRPKSLITDKNPYQNDTIYIHLIWNLLTYLETMYENGYRNFVSGGAQGFDQLAFLAVDLLKKNHSDVQNIVFIPFRGQHSRWAYTGIFSQTEYTKMLNDADAVVCINTEILPSQTPYHQIAHAMFERNHAMLTVSSYVIGQYPDDTWQLPNTKSGTAKTLRKAMNLPDITICVHDFRKSTP